MVFIFTILSLKYWRQTGVKEKTTYKMNCKWLIIKWAQLGSNLDLPLRKAPGELFRQGLDCRGGSRPDGSTEALIDASVIRGGY